MRFSYAVLAGALAFATPMNLSVDFAYADERGMPKMDSCPNLRTDIIKTLDRMGCRILQVIRACRGIKDIKKSALIRAIMLAVQLISQVYLVRTLK